MSQRTSCRTRKCGDGSMGWSPPGRCSPSTVLRTLRQEPSAVATAIRIANDLNADEIASSAVARNTFILLQQAIERGGLPLTATGNLSRAVVAEMRELIKWPSYGQTDAFRLHKVINEPDFLPLRFAIRATYLRQPPFEFAQGGRRREGNWSSPRKVVRPEVCLLT